MCAKAAITNTELLQKDRPLKRNWHRTWDRAPEAKKEQRQIIRALVGHTCCQVAPEGLKESCEKKGWETALLKRLFGVASSAYEYRG